MGDLEVTIRHGGGGGIPTGAVVGLFAAGFAAVAIGAAAHAIAAIPVYVAVGIPVAAVAGLMVAVWAQIQRNRRKGAEVAAAWQARREVIENAEETRAARRRAVGHAEALALAAAGAPVIHNNVTIDADAIAAALYRQHTQAPGRQEIPQ